MCASAHDQVGWAHAFASARSSSSRCLALTTPHGQSCERCAMSSFARFTQHHIHQVESTKRAVCGWRTMVSQTFASCCYTTQVAYGIRLLYCTLYSMCTSFCHSYLHFCCSRLLVHRHRWRASSSFMSFMSLSLPLPSTPPASSYAPLPHVSVRVASSSSSSSSSSSAVSDASCTVCVRVNVVAFVAVAACSVRFAEENGHTTPTPYV